ncbi:MAG: phosphonate C-P lyase system protein PhnH [Pseudonocardiaceae bacterium]
MSAELGLPPLDHHSSQRVFRILLEALARPGTVQHLPADLVDVDVPVAVLVPLALADLEVTLAVLETGGPDWASRLERASGAERAAPERADMVLALRAPRPDEVRGLRRGTPDRPELGCRLVLACADLSATTGEVLVELTGPGVAGSAQLAVDGLPVEVLEALVAVNRRFPQGVDTYLVATDGHVVGLPRTTRVNVRAGAGTWATTPTGRS